MVSTTLRLGNGASDVRVSYARIPSVFDVPNLLQVQLGSFNWLKTDGLRELFEEISPIEDQTGDRFELTFEDHYFDEPKYTEAECREKEITYTAALYVTVSLKIKAAGAGQGEIKEQTLFLGDIPMMTSTGTFIINGAERVVVSQLVRSPGVYFTADLDRQHRQAARVRQAHTLPSTSPPTSTPTPAGRSRPPSSYPTAAPGWSSRRATATSSP